MKILYKKIAITVISFALIFGSFYINTDSRKSRKVGASNIDSRPVIIVDAGHGGFDGGAVALDGTLEKDINLQISLQLGELLTASGFNVVYTRVADTGTEDDTSASIAVRKKSDMRNRLQIIKNNPNAIFASIHLNKFTTSVANGAQTFYSVNNQNSKHLSECIQNTVVSLLQPNNQRTVKTAPNGNYLLNNSTVPSVIVECGFLSNKQELELLKSEEYCNKMAFAIYCGILKYY